jgi:hypothetical protein
MWQHWINNAVWDPDAVVFGENIGVRDAGIYCMYKTFRKKQLFGENWTAIYYTSRFVPSLHRQKKLKITISVPTYTVTSLL